MVFDKTTRLPFVDETHLGIRDHSQEETRQRDVKVHEATSLTRCLDLERKLVESPGNQQAELEG